MFRALLIAIACASLGVAHAAAGAEASALFADGERAFAAGDYEEALRLFVEARAAGSTGPSSYYNIGVCQYQLRDYRAAEATFRALVAEFPAMRELAEYNRGLALRAAGNLDDARVAFERARSSMDDTIVALASAQLGQIGAGGAAQVAAEPKWSGYFAGGLGYDDNVALLNELVLPSSEASSPLAEVIGVATRDFGARPLLFDASAYAVHYSDVGDLDQTAVRLSLATEQRLGTWTLVVGPTLGRSTVDGDGFEELVGADFRARRSFGSGFVFEARALYDDSSAADTRFAYIDGSRRLVRLVVQHTGAGRARFGYDAEHNDRADPGVSPTRERWSIVYQRPLAQDWNIDTAFSYRTSRYSEAGVPRDERLQEASLAVRRDLRGDWALGVEYQWFDNNSTAEEFTYDGQRIVLGLSRSFYGN
jgi:tetratricopeptide (TPR) repeat protein